MKHTLILAAIGLVMAFAACKPGDENLNPTPTGLLSGYLLATRILDADSPAKNYTEEAMAVFFKHPGDTGLRTLVDSIQLNSSRLNVDNPNLLYRINAGGMLRLNDTCNWQVWSSSNNPSFNYNYTKGYPIYTAATRFPDTISIGGGLGLDMPLNMDSATVSVSDGINKAMTSSKGSVAYMYNLSSLNTGYGTLQVNAYRVSTQTFGGKNFLFMKQIIRSKTVYLR